MSQDWTNEHQRRYAIDDSTIQNPLFQRSCLLKKKENATKNRKSNFPSHKEEEKLLHIPTAMLTDYLKLTTFTLTYTVTLNFVLKMLSIINLPTSSEIKGSF